MEMRFRLLSLWGLVMVIWLYVSIFKSSAATSFNVTESVVGNAEIYSVTESEPTTAQTQTAETATATAYTVIKSEIDIPNELEEYVLGVVAAEMPVYFPVEALKAQAVAARTYAYREYCMDKNVDLYKIGQAYVSPEQLKEKWGKDFDTNFRKIKKAVDDTQGQIIMYDNQPILAAFCSASGGKTESCENVWGQPLPYLKSVDSQLDKNAPVYSTEKSFSSKQLKKLLGGNDLSVLSRSNAGYVLQAKSGDKLYDGDEVRTKLGLKSTDFEVKNTDNGIIVTTYGFGHGVGMSQYGACYMAEQTGSDYVEILKHYYSDVEIVNTK